jgi:cytochrome c oxidase subunit 4
MNFSVYLALLALLGSTFLLSFVNLGRFNFALSLLIAAAKALLVILFFMRLRERLPVSASLHRLFAMAGVFWLSILLTLSLSDLLSRGWLLLPGKWP